MSAQVTLYKAPGSAPAVYAEVSGSDSEWFEYELYLNSTLQERIKSPRPGYLFRMKNAGVCYVVVKTADKVLQSDNVVWHYQEVQPVGDCRKNRHDASTLKGVSVSLDNEQGFYIEAKIRKGSFQEVDTRLKSINTGVSFEPCFVNTESFPEWHSLHQYEYYVIRHDLSREAMDTLCNQIEDMDCVIYCSPAPIADDLLPPVIEDAGLREYIDSEENIDTPDFSLLQGYLEGGAGMNIRSVMDKGNTGDRATIRFLDFGIYQHHEDFQAGNIHVVSSRDETKDCNHGTASVGCIASGSNEFGVTGIANGSPFYFYDTGDLDKILEQANPGDIVGLDIQWNTDRGYIPAIGIKSWWDRIQMLTEKGVIVLAAAGNGANDLSDTTICPDYGDSGAMLVGACNSGDGRRRPLSNYGHYASVINSWGEDVVTTGYGYLQSKGGNNRNYTDRYSGTSSATPLCVGALSLLQSYAKQKGLLLTPETMKAVIELSGYTEGVDDKIGKRPDVAQLTTVIDRMVLSSVAGVSPFPVSSNYVNYNVYLSSDVDNTVNIHFDYRFSDIRNAGVIAYYEAEGPSELEWYSYGNSSLTVPLRNEQGDIYVVYLKASKVNSVGAFTMNSAADPKGKSPDAFDLSLTFHTDDNVYLPEGIYEGVLPLYIKSWTHEEYMLPVRLNVFIN